MIAFHLPAQPHRERAFRTVRWRDFVLSRSAGISNVLKAPERRPSSIDYNGRLSWSARPWQPLSGGGLHPSRNRAINLLKEWLSPEQLAQYESDRIFDVIGGQSGKRYRIRSGTSMNICEIDSRGRMIEGLCFAPNEILVAGDVMLTQKIALETDECSVLAVARRFTPTWN